MSESTRSSVPRLMRGCRLSTAEGQTDMLLIPEGALRLKGPAHTIVELCDGELTSGQIVDELTRRYPAGDAATIEAEAIAFLTRLRERGVIEFL